MSFSDQKKAVLSRIDNSKKGSIDARIRKVTDAVNSLRGFYTTSSCSGRIMLYEKKSDKKYDTNWLFVSHDPVRFEQLDPYLQNLPGNPVWLREEAMILHVCADKLDDAQEFLRVSRECGFKRAGIISSARRIMIEITSTEVMDAIIAEKGRLIVSPDYLKRFIFHANSKLRRNFAKIAKLERAISQFR